MVKSRSARRGRVEGEGLQVWGELEGSDFALCAFEAVVLVPSPLHVM